MVEDWSHPYKILADRRCEEFVDALVHEARASDHLLGFTNSAADGSPDWFNLGGSGARLRWMLAHALPPDVDMHWNAAAPLQGRLLLFTYTDDNDTLNPFPAAAWEESLRSVIAQRGEPQRREYPFGNAERVDLYLFPESSAER